MRYLKIIFIYCLFGYNNTAHCTPSKASLTDNPAMQSRISDDNRFIITTLTTSLDKPWGMAFLPNKQALITERPGGLILVDLETGEQKARIDGLPKITAIGQGGLLDVEIDPNFQKSPWVYVSYVASKNGLHGTEVGRGKLLNNKLVDFETIFIAQPKTSGGHHFGSRLVFDNKDHLFITLGDRGKRYEAQDTASHIGTIIRIHKDGGIPNDNPFAHNAKALSEIYAYGNRNVQGAALDPQSNQLWTHEHGPQGGDEINIIKAGINYGWPIITYGKEYGVGKDIGEGTHKKGMQQPIHQWTPSIAPSGMAIYNSDLFANWKGNILAGALKYQMLVRLSVNGNQVKEEERLFEKEFGRIRNVDIDEKGRIYLLTDSNNGQIIRIEPNHSSVPSQP